MIRKENRILTPGTVSVQSDLHVLNAAISHGAILMMKICERKPGKNEPGRILLLFSLHDNSGSEKRYPQLPGSIATASVTTAPGRTLTLVT